VTADRSLGVVLHARAAGERTPRDSGLCRWTERTSYLTARCRGRVCRPSGPPWPFVSRRQPRRLATAEERRRAPSAGELARSRRDSSRFSLARVCLLRSLGLRESRQLRWRYYAARSRDVSSGAALSPISGWKRRFRRRCHRGRRQRVAVTVTEVFPQVHFSSRGCPHFRSETDALIEPVYSVRSRLTASFPFDLGRYTILERFRRSTVRITRFPVLATKPNNADAPFTAF
jgi:hypothetical protein